MNIQEVEQLLAEIEHLGHDWSWDEYSLDVRDHKFDPICADVMTDGLGPFIAAAPDIVRQMLDYIKEEKPLIARLHELNQQSETREPGIDVLTWAANEIERLQQKVQFLEDLVAER